MDAFFKLNHDELSSLKENMFREPLCSKCIHIQKLGIV